MIRYENHCCDCASPAYPCLGKRCPLTRVLVTECDRCGCDEDLYYWNGKQLCIDCILDKLSDNLDDDEYVLDGKRFTEEEIIDLLEPVIIS